MSFWSIFTDLFMLFIGLSQMIFSVVLIYTAIMRQMPNRYLQGAIAMHLFFAGMAAFAGAELLEQLVP